MTGIFDGLGSLIRDTFGSNVQVTPHMGVTRTVKARFREQPIQIPGPEGVEVTTILPIVDVDRAEVADMLPTKLRPGAVIDPGNGRTYRCVDDLNSGSPATDALVTIQLERL